MSKASDLIATFIPQTRAAYLAAGGKLSYEEVKQPNYIIAQAGGVAGIYQPYAQPWLKAVTPTVKGQMFAVPCLCSTPNEIIGCVLRPFGFNIPSGGHLWLMVAQCDFCHRIYWSEHGEEAR